MEDGHTSNKKKKKKKKKIKLSNEKLATSWSARKKADFLPHSFLRAFMLFIIWPK